MLQPLICGTFIAFLLTMFNTYDRRKITRLIGRSVSYRRWSTIHNFILWIIGRWPILLKKLQTSWPPTLYHRSFFNTMELPWNAIDCCQAYENKSNFLGSTCFGWIGCFKWIFVDLYIFPKPPREGGGSRCTADVRPDQIFCRESDERMYYRPES